MINSAPKQLNKLYIIKLSSVKQTKLKQAQLVMAKKSQA